MFKTKLQLIITTILILFFVLVGCNPKQTSKIDHVKESEKGNPSSRTISSKDVELVNRIGRLPLSKSKVLFALKDYSTINKIVTLVNYANTTEFNTKDYGGGKSIGYPISVEIKLQTNAKWRITPLYKVISRTLENGGRESTATPYKDRVELDIENGKKSSSYTLFSEQLANYVLEGASQDMPSVRAFSLTPDTIKPGQTMIISGDGSTEKYIEICITDGNSASKEKYLIAKVPTSFGAWKWEGTINGRSVRTLDGKDIKLTRDRYSFQTTVAGGGTIDLSGSK